MAGFKTLSGVHDKHCQPWRARRRAALRGSIARRTYRAHKWRALKNTSYCRLARASYIVRQLVLLTRASARHVRFGTHFSGGTITSGQAWRIRNSARAITIICVQPHNNERRGKAPASAFSVSAVTWHSFHIASSLFRDHVSSAYHSISPL